MKFFRKIRQQLLSENKLGKYITYAIGEIILVVIGILIALAINNASERNAIQKKEKIYLAGLQEEFETGKLKLKKLIEVNRQNLDGAKQLMAFISTKEKQPDEKQFSEILYNTFAFDIAFNPNNSLLHEMINSGSLKDISNSKLKIYLTNWIATLDDIAKQEDDLGIQRNKILDMFRSEMYSLKTVLKLSAVTEDEKELSTSDQRISNLNLLRSTEFENNILMFILSTQSTETEHYLPLLKDIDTILKLIDTELD